MKSTPIGLKNIQALWLQGCRTLGTGEIVPDQQEETSADHHTMRVGNVLEEDHLEQSLADLDMEFSATLDQDNPLSSRYLRVFPRATVFGWTKTAPGEKAKSQYSIPFHIAHIARLNSKEDHFPTSKPIDETLDQESAVQYIDSLLNLLNRRDKGDECEDLSIEAWKKHGRVEDQRTGLGFLNPDLNAYPALVQRSDDDLLKQARLLDCILNNSKDEESLLKAIDEIMKNPKLIHYTFNSLLDKLKTLKQKQPDLHKKILDKLKSSSEMSQFLAQKLESPSLGILRKIDYFAFYEEVYGKSDKIRSVLLDQSIKILKSTQSDDSYDVRDYKITLMESLGKHGYLDHPKGISVLEQGMKDSSIAVRSVAVQVAGDIGEPALHIVEQGMKDSDKWVRMDVVQAAGEIGEPALHIVEQGMKDSNTAVRMKAVKVAVEIGEPAFSLIQSQGLPILEQAVTDRDSIELRERAVRLAGEIGEPALHIVEQGMKDSDKYVRMKAVAVAVEIGGPAFSLIQSQGLPILEQGMKDSHWSVRINAVETAGEIGETALPVLEQGMKDSDKYVRMKAVAVAVEIGGPAFPLLQSQGLPILEQAVTDRDSIELRERAVRLAGEIGKPALPLLIQAMNNLYSEELRMDVVQAAGKMGKPALPLLRQMLEKDIPRDTKKNIERLIDQIN